MQKECRQDKEDEVTMIYDNVKIACKERGLSVQELEKTLDFQEVAYISGTNIRLILKK